MRTRGKRRGRRGSVRYGSRWAHALDSSGAPSPSARRRMVPGSSGAWHSARALRNDLPGAPFVPRSPVDRSSPSGPRTVPVTVKWRYSVARCSSHRGGEGPRVPHDPARRAAHDRWFRSGHAVASRAGRDPPGYLLASRTWVEAAGRRAPSGTWTCRGFLLTRRSQGATTAGTRSTRRRTVPSS